MGVVPTLRESCFCCTLKTGSFVTAWFLLVGASVQLGYYTFLVDHIHPQKLCNYTELIRVKVDPSEYADHGYDRYDRYDPYGPDDYDDIFRWFYGPPPREKNVRPQGRDAANTTDGKKKNSTYTTNTTVGEATNSSNTANTAVGEPTNSSNAANTVGELSNSRNEANTTVGEPTNSSKAVNTMVGEPTNSSNAADTTVGKPTNSSNAVNTTVGKPTNSSNAANTRVGEPTNSSNAVRKDATVSNRRSSWGRRRHGPPLIPWGGWPFRSFSPYGGGWKYKESIYQRPCPRDYKPFDADSGLLDFDMRGSERFDKIILYFNIGVWGILMVATIPLMVAVYKDSAYLVGAWLVVETVMMAVAAAGTIATAAAMFRVVPVQIGIVTLINMAIHLGINSYMLMVVYNYRRKLLGKLKDEDEEEDQQVIVRADNLAVEHA